MKTSRIPGALGSSVILLFLSCAPRTKPRVAPPEAPPVDWAARVEDADTLAARGNYLSLRNAVQIYEGILAIPEWKDAAAEKYVRTALAFSLRAKELGIRPDGIQPRIREVIASQTALASYSPLADLLAFLPNKIKGVAGDNLPEGLSLEDFFEWANAHLGAIDDGLGLRAESDPLRACLRIVLRQAFPYKFEDKLNPAEEAARFPGSRLLAFQAAISPSPDPDLLKALLAVDPEFIEAHYFLGELALLTGKLITAEKHHLEVHGRIPESPSALISLAKIAFQMEELEPCLAYNEEALALVPTYRDALLGKAMCLGYIGRGEEALDVLQRILELGSYYIGEAHYWKAWNLSELGRLEEARRAVDTARVLLVGVSDVTTLSGIIAYKQGRLEDAERDLRDSLDLTPEDCEAAFTLAKVYTDRKEWLNAGIYFSGAAACYEQKQLACEKKIGEIEAAELAPERKERLVKKKRFQVLSLEATKATCQYNGAAGFHNAGVPDRALDMARLAAAHPAFADKAAELIKIITSREPRLP